MPKFRKKPVVIEARQFTGENPAENIAIAEWCGAIYEAWGEPRLRVPTLEGDHLAMPGDFIIRGIKGEFYPCKPDIFEATYEQADDDAGPAEAP